MAYSVNSNHCDRYNWEHRKDPDYQIGESMPGTFGDSEGTLHDRLGGQPTVDGETVSEPGQKARQRDKAKQKEAGETSKVSMSERSGETTTVTLQDSADGEAIGYHRGHRVHVKEASKGGTVLVTLEKQRGRLEGSRIRLRE